MSESTAVIITGIIVMLIGIIFSINETIRPFGILIILASFIVICIGLFLYIQGS